MRKVLSFSAFLVVGLFIAQYLPAWSGSDYSTVKTVSNVLLYICLGFIMINVGREFEVDKSRWQTYAKDYFVAIGTDGHFLIVVQHGVELSGIVGPHGEVLLQPGLERFETVHPQKAAKP